MDSKDSSPKTVLPKLCLRNLPAVAPQQQGRLRLIIESWVWHESCVRLGLRPGSRVTRWNTTTTTTTSTSDSGPSPSRAPSPWPTAVAPHWHALQTPGLLRLALARLGPGRECGARPVVGPSEPPNT